jgi:hypothetical protein
MSGDLIMNFRPKSLSKCVLVGILFCCISKSFGIPSPITPLKKAAFVGDVNAVNQLISSGTNPDGELDHGLSPLHLCARAGNKEIAKVLLAYGADINATNIFKKTPIQHAEYMKQDLFAQFLRDITKTK